MKKYCKVIDNQQPIQQNYWGIVFCRGENIKEKISLIRWVWFCLVEILFGEEVLESLVITASLSGCPEDNDFEGRYGLPQQLNLHIPSGIFTNYFRSQIIQILYYKYFMQYRFINPVVEKSFNTEKNIINVTRVRFRLDKKLLYLVIAFRRVYLVSALAFNIVVNVVVYFYSNSVEVVFISAFFIESARRLFKL